MGRAKWHNEREREREGDADGAWVRVQKRVRDMHGTVQHGERRRVERERETMARAAG